MRSRYEGSSSSQEVDERAYAELGAIAVETEGLVEHLSVKPNKNKKQSIEKWMSYFFRSGEEIFSKSIRSSFFARYELDKKLLLSVGQVNTERFNCFRTIPEKLGFVERMVNKGLAPEGIAKRPPLEEMIRAEEELGHIRLNGVGPEITEEGIKYLNETIKGRSKGSVEV